MPRVYLVQNRRITKSDKYSFTIIGEYLSQKKKVCASERPEFSTGVACLLASGVRFFARIFLKLSRMIFEQFACSDARFFGSIFCKVNRISVGFQAVYLLGRTLLCANIFCIKLNIRISVGFKAVCLLGCAPAFLREFFVCMIDCFILCLACMVNNWKYVKFNCCKYV